MNLVIDPTTDSIVFNPLSAQGQWVNHRFGKRQIEYQLDIDTLIDYISTLNNLDHVDLISVFGDPMCYTNILELVEFLNKNYISVTVVTYGMGDIKLFEHLSNMGTYFVFKTTGIKDKVFLNTDWNIIKQNLDVVKNKQIQFYKFKHNKIDLEYLNESYNNVFDYDGDCIAGDLSNVVNEEGKWLYDIHKVDSKKPTLEKTLQGYHYLKHFVKKVNGKSILDDPVNLILPNAQHFEMPQENDRYLTVSGHLFDNLEKMQMFSNALCDDWAFEYFDLNYEYEKKVYYVLSKMIGKKLDHINSSLSN